MSRTLLLVGTRKGCFLVESDADRAKWEVRGPFCEGWPVYHAIHDPGTDAIYAAAASEWHGSAVWRSADRGETWTHSSEGLAYDADGASQAVEGLEPGRERRPDSRGRRGARDLREPGRRLDLVAALDARRATGQRRLGRPGESAAGPPRHLGAHVRRGQRLTLLGDRPGHRHLRDRGRRLLVDASQQGPARRLAATPRRGRVLRAQAGALACRPRPHVPAEPCRHVAERRPRALVDRDHRGAADRVRLRRRHASPRPRHVLRRAARPRPHPHDAGRRGGRLADARRRLELAAARQWAAAA